MLTSDKVDKYSIVYIICIIYVGWDGIISILFLLYKALTLPHTLPHETC